MGQPLSLPAEHYQAFLLVRRGVPLLGTLALLVLARRFGHGDLVEAPVRIGRRFTSTVSPKVVAEMLRDTFAIWWRLNVRHGYPRP